VQEAISNVKRVKLCCHLKKGKTIEIENTENNDDKGKKYHCSGRAIRNRIWKSYIVAETEMGYYFSSTP